VTTPEKRPPHARSGVVDPRDAELAGTPVRLALGPDEAAASLSVSRDFFDRHIAPELRIVRRGRRRLVPVRELERWLDVSAALALDRERSKR
jgi:excisionase family DNA binding protein